MAALINGPVGNNMANDEEDVLNVKGALAETERYEEDEPHGYVTRGMDTAIRDLQREKDLKEDGIMFPGGETETVLVEDMDRKRSENPTPPVPKRKPDASEKRNELDQELKKNSQKDCSGPEIEFANASAAFVIAEQRLEGAEAELAEAEEKLISLEDKIGREKKTASKLHKAGGAGGAVTGGIAGGLFGIPAGPAGIAAGAMLGAGVGFGAGSTTARVAEEIGDEITGEGSLIRLEVEEARLEDLITTLQEKVASLRGARDTAQQMMDAARSDYMACKSR